MAKLILALLALVVASTSAFTAPASAVVTRAQTNAVPVSMFGGSSKKAAPKKGAKVVKKAAPKAAKKVAKKAVKKAAPKKSGAPKDFDTLLGMQHAFESSSFLNFASLTLAVRLLLSSL